MNNNIDFEGPIYTNYNVICPAGCAKLKKPVIGNEIFKDDSPICLAAI